MLQDTKSDFTVAVSLVPASRTAATYNGTSVDLTGYHSAAVVFSTGDLASGTATPTIQESSNGTSGWADIAADRLNGTLAAVSANSTLVIGLTDIGNTTAGITKKFVRATIVVAGGSGTLCSAYVIRGNAQHNPAGGSSTILVG